MLKLFTIRILDEHGVFKRLMKVYANDYEMALCMVANVIGDNEFTA